MPFSNKRAGETGGRYAFEDGNKFNDDRVTVTVGLSINETAYSDRGITFDDFEKNFVVDADNDANTAPTLKRYLLTATEAEKGVEVHSVNNTWLSKVSDAPIAPISNIQGAAREIIFQRFPDPVLEAMKKFEAQTPRIFANQIIQGNNPDKFKFLLGTIFARFGKQDELAGFIRLLDPYEEQNKKAVDATVEKLIALQVKTIKKPSPLWADTMAAAMYIAHTSREYAKRGLNSPYEIFLVDEGAVAVMTEFLKNYIPMHLKTMNANARKGGAAAAGSRNRFAAAVGIAATLAASFLALAAGG